MSSVFLDSLNSLCERSIYTIDKDDITKRYIKHNIKDIISWGGYAQSEYKKIYDSYESYISKKLFKSFDSLLRELNYAHMGSYLWDNRVEFEEWLYGYVYKRLEYFISEHILSFNGDKIVLYRAIGVDDPGLWFDRLSKGKVRLGIY